MSYAFSSLPPGFSWLKPAYRPTEEEVDEYAHVIANAEGYPAESNAVRLHREAELQLWIWRAETRQRARLGERRRGARAGSMLKPSRSRTSHGAS